MKIENDIDLISLPKQEIQDKINKESKFIGSILHKAGHTLFEINLKTGAIKEAVITKKVSVGIDMKPVFERKVCVNKDCYYLEALNVRNAKKKFLKKMIQPTSKMNNQ